jgi:dTDP-4-amino-4,6-dideoxygalactose transaminase
LLYQKSKDYRDNFTHLKKMLSVSDLIEIPDDDPREDRALDSIQFRLRGFTSAETEKFVALVKKRGIPIAGLGEPGNARAAWNWLYLDAGELPQTREYLSNACDLRLVITLTSDMIEYLAVAFIESADQVQRGAA